MNSNNYIYNYIKGNFYDKNGTVLYKSSLLKNYNHQLIVENLLLNFKVINTIKRIHPKNEEKLFSCFSNIKTNYNLSESSLKNKDFWNKSVYVGHVYNLQGKSICETEVPGKKKHISKKTRGKKTRSEDSIRKIKNN